MSPLACSLFALAAVLATAHGYCTTKHVGQKTGTEVPYQPVNFQPPGVEIHVDDNHCPPPMRVVGEDIKACSNDPYGPAPHINGPYPPSFSPFQVTCSQYECPYGGNVEIIQYCGY